MTSTAVATKHYEAMFLLHNREPVDLPEGETPPTPEEVVKALVEKAGGELAHAFVWANRKLAYPIQGNQTGSFVLSYLSGSAEMCTEIQRLVRISDRVLRVLMIAVPRVPSEDELPGPLNDAAGRGRRDDPVPEPPPPRKPAVEGEEPKEDEQRERWSPDQLDYKNVHYLRRMVTAQGKLFSRVRSTLPAKYQRRLRVAVLRARNIALLPFVAR